MSEGFLFSRLYEGLICGSCIYEMLGRDLWLKTTTLVCPLALVSKIFEKLVNNRPSDNLEKCGLFSHSQYDFRSSWSNVDLLTVLSDRISSVFNRSGATLQS